MKINKISLFNFKSYAGLHEIDLSVNNEKNVVLLIVQMALAKLLF